MRGHRKLAIAVVMVAAAGCTGTASAGVPVIDVANLVMNAMQSLQLKKIQKTLTRNDSGTINYYTNNIDKSTTKIDESTHNIDNSTAITSNNSIINTEIDADLDFTLIINKGGNGEIIPVPRPIQELLKEIHEHGKSDAYAAHFGDAASYYGRSGDKEAVDAGFEGSRARKAANNALVKSLDLEQDRIADDAQALKDLAGMNKEVKGHARQLQVANAIAGSQANQMLEIRSMMLASESARAAESQAAADKEARAIATGKHLREGLDKAASAASRPLPML
ncbi:P-type conjugative transfer protein TrbJ [Luteibacter sp. 1214]|uniref:hypothetical protein n=1 Tax=Luteibacter sp. 1214 TaxID=2817735 RepID=UPI0005BD9613|nr:hypothetical protein [Luteibacter sp. 1214]MDR6642301.1 P-type conjugative transfer protein TrbJ [Luteibacter sp. 1214]